MANNENIKALLFNARLICLAKAQAVEAKLSGPNPEVQVLNTRLHTFFGHLSNPKFWSQPIDADLGKLSQEVLDISSVDPTSVPQYLTAVRKFLQNLEDTVLQSALRLVASTTTETWNLRMLNVLRKIQQTMIERKGFFKNKGEDLNQNSQFQSMETTYRTLVSSYRELLTNNGVSSDQAKVNNMKARGTNLSNAVQSSIYLRLYQKLSDIIKGEVATASAMPTFSSIPVALNQQAINALSVTLVKVSREIAKLKSKGTDLSQDATFTSLASEQQTLANDFRAALYNNTCTATAADVTQLSTLGNKIEQSTDKATFLTEYRALNQLMKDKIPATA